MLGTLPTALARPALSKWFLFPRYLMLFENAVIISMWVNGLGMPSESRNTIYNVSCFYCYLVLFDNAIEILLEMFQISRLHWLVGQHLPRFTDTKPLPLSTWEINYEPPHEKTCLRIFRPSPTQAGLCNHRRLL